jgi:hypothetical protein
MGVLVVRTQRLAAGVPWVQGNLSPSTPAQHGYLQREQMS